MSVKEKPAANRYLEQKEQEKAYKKHMTAVANARPTINTTQPELPGRLRELNKKNQAYRKATLKTYEKRDKMMGMATGTTRPKSEYSTQATSARQPYNMYQDIDLFSRDRDRYRADNIRSARRTRYESSSSSSSDFDDPSDYESSSSDSRKNNYETLTSTSDSIQKRQQESERIRIGFGDKLIDTEDPNSTDSTSILTGSEVPKYQKKTKIPEKKMSSKSSALSSARNSALSSGAKKSSSSSKIKTKETKPPIMGDTFLTSMSNHDEVPASVVIDEKIEPITKEEKKEVEQPTQVSPKKGDSGAEDLFESSDFDSDSSSSSSKSSKSDKDKDQKNAEKEEEKKPEPTKISSSSDSSDNNFMDDDLDMPDF